MKETRLKCVVASVLPLGIEVQAQYVEVTVVDGEIINEVLIGHERYSLAALTPEQRSVLDGIWGTVTTGLATQAHALQAEVEGLQTELEQHRMTLASATGDWQGQVEELQNQLTIAQAELTSAREALRLRRAQVDINPLPPVFTEDRPVTEPL